MQENKAIIIKNLIVYGESQTFAQGYIKIMDGQIADLGNVQDVIEDSATPIYDFPSQYHCVPGMIDMHIHGVADADAMDATDAALDTMTQKLAEEGTTSFLATTITQDHKHIERALAHIAKYIEANQKSGQAEIIGIHLEGPFISPKRAGAQPLESIIPPNIPLFEKWQKIANNTIKLVTLAPEERDGLDLVEYLHNQGIISSIGHSNASYEQVDKAIYAGASHITHLFNGMRGIHHREPGTAGAALMRDELTVEMIVDGIHIHPEMVRLAFRQKPLDRMVLITDSMRAKCLQDGQYDLGGQTVTVQGDRVYLKDGVLAGSMLKMNQAVKNMVTYTNCSMNDIVQMTSVNPAKELKIYDRKGSLQKGKDADVVILNENYEVVMTICRGDVAFRRKENNL